MNKKIIKYIMLIFALFIITVLTGCNKNTSTKNTVTITDSVGDKVEVPVNPDKVACVSRMSYDLLVAYGLGDKIDGAYKGTLKNKWVETLYPNAKDHFSYGYKNSAESFMERKIDLVFAPEKYIAEELRNHGVTAITISLYGTPNFDKHVTLFSDIITQIWDSKDVKKKADKWKNDVNTAIDTIKAELSKHEMKKRKVYYVRGDKNIGVGYTDTIGSFTEYAYRVLGFDFVGTKLETSKPSVEEIIKFNPDVFVCGGIYQKEKKAELFKPPFTELEAIKNNRVYGIPIGLSAFEQISIMTPIFFYDQANKIFPEYFSFDINKMVKKTIKEYFNIDLPDEKVGYMLEGLDANGKKLSQ